MADDKTPTEPTTAVPSPTGTPVISPKAFGWVALAATASLAALGALTAIYPDVHGLQVALAVLTAVAAVLGIASPGLRKGTVALLLVASMGIGGCAWWQRTQPQLIDCGAKAIQEALPDVVGDVSSALGGESVAWRESLEGIATQRGMELAWCALRVVVSSLETGSGGAGVGFVPPPGVPPSVRLLRAYAWMEGHPAQAK